MLLLLALLLFGISVYLFIIFIIKRDHGHREPVGALLTAMGFGIGAVVLAAIAENYLVPSAIIASNTGGAAHVPTLQLAYGTLMVGFIEETLKSVPLALFIYKKRYFDELTDGVIYFGISALAFSVLEDIMYTLAFGGVTGIVRVIMSPYVHVGFATLFGMSLAYHKILGRSKWIIVGGYIAAVLSHAVYDFFAFGGAGIVGDLFMLLIALGLNALLFVGFRWAQKRDETRGQSTIGINKFCRHCGTPNPQKLLYCSHCGKLS